MARRPDSPLYTLIWLGAALLALTCTARAALDRAPRALDLSEMLQIAQGHIESGDYAAALLAYDATVDAYPENPVSHYELAGAQAFLRLYVPASEAIRNAIRLAPDEPRYYALAALLFEQLGNRKRVLQAYLAGARLGDAAAMFALVAIYERGLGVSANPSTALVWAIASAEAGHLGAMALLIRIYHEGGLGVSPDVEQAAVWRARLTRAEKALN